jgi:hypothetical protein
MNRFQLFRNVWGYSCRAMASKESCNGHLRPLLVTPTTRPSSLRM